MLAQWGKQDAVFTCPTAIIHKFYLPGATGQAPMSSPEVSSRAVIDIARIGEPARNPCRLSISCTSQDIDSYENIKLVVTLY